MNPRQALRITAASLAVPIGSPSAEQARAPRIRLAASTYSYWHLKGERYPIEKVIGQAAAHGFDGDEILHRQMTDESPGYVNAQAGGVPERARPGDASTMPPSGVG